MRGDVMQWVGRAVAIVFGMGVLAMGAAIVALLRRAEGVPPLPIFLGIVGLAVLILLAGACLALISIAVSLRRGAAPVTAPVPAQAEPAPMQGPFTPKNMRRAEGGRPGRVLVAER